MKKYEIIYNYIREEWIKIKGLETMIPNEIDIAQKFDVSRMTVNKAIKNLVDEGYLKRVKGQGTFIISKTSKTEKDLGELRSYSEDMQKRGITPTTKLIHYQKVEHPPEHVKQKMKLQNDEKLHYIVRVRYDGKTPISLDYTYVSTKYVPILNIDKLTSSLFDIYEKNLGIKIEYSDQEIYAEVANEEIADLLSINQGDPLLCIEGLTNTSNNQVFEYTTVYYVSKSYRITKRAVRS